MCIFMILTLVAHNFLLTIYTATRKFRQVLGICLPSPYTASFQALSVNTFR